MGRRTHHPQSLSRYFLFHKNLNHQAWLVRRDVYKRCGDFLSGNDTNRSNHPIGSDQEFLWRVVLREKLRTQYLNIIIANFLFGGNSTRKSIFKRSMIERWKFIREYYSTWEILFYGLASMYFLIPLKSYIWFKIHPEF